jgi:capsular exopolysaccharide synthesis family protein
VRPVDRLTVVTPARTAPDPVAPHPKKDAVLAFIAALIVNAELAVLLAAIGGRFVGDDVADQVTALTGIPVLAELPQSGRRGDGPVVEALRTLRTNLQFVGDGEELRSVAVVGGERGSGKSFVAENLAKTMVGPGAPVVLVDADLRGPTLHARLGLPLNPGLADALAPPYTFGRPMEVEDHRNLRFIPAGSRPGDPAAMFTGDLFARLLERMERAGVVVVDTPPLSLFADGAAVAHNCDATILVIDVQSTRRRDVGKMADTLSQVGVKPTGIVLNRVRTTGRARSYENYRTRRSS